MPSMGSRHYTRPRHPVGGQTCRRENPLALPSSYCPCLSLWRGCRVGSCLYFESGSMPSAPRKQQANMMMGPPQMTTDPTSLDGDGEPEEKSVVEAKLDRRLFSNSHMCLGAPKYVLTAPTQSTKRPKSIPSSSCMRRRRRRSGSVSRTTSTPSPQARSSTCARCLRRSLLRRWSIRQARLAWSVGLRRLALPALEPVLEFILRVPGKTWYQEVWDIHAL